ncbi:hypothetical protein LSH36_456g03038 [Paralvinella palmiformis]|uniref:Nuclear pore complex protein Nup153 n=1 Tax=Paralvinella palmiformis TaxID=53620 RepID=A0AAD9JA04_9ANNE|nr:hypothetical protein LSH36_456g03038 [Paralvinella palmiformis]
MASEGAKNFRPKPYNERGRRSERRRAPCPPTALPGPSKLLPQMPVGGDDRSEFSDCSVSTSGCSSMAGNQDKDFQQEASRLAKSNLQKPDFGSSHIHKRGESSFLWSGSISRPPNKSLISRKTSHVTTQSRTPSFNISVFGSPLSKTTASRSSQGDSHFYPGKTVFGGASSQKKRKLQETSPQLTPNKRQVHAKPVSSSISGVTSTSARRILSVLERMSSPLQDAKKIPSYNSSLADSPLSFTPSSIASTSRRRNVPYRMGSSSLLKGPPVRALITPGRVQVAKNYQSSLGQKDSAETRTNPSKSSGQLQPTSSTQSYTDFSVGGGSRPVQWLRSSSYYNMAEIHVVAPDLPTGFTLPVSVVPKFSFGYTPSSSQQSVISQTKHNASDGIFTFSTPIPQSKPDPATSCSNFQFSSPITMDTTPSRTMCQKTAISTSLTDHTSSMSNSKPDLSFRFNPTMAKSKSASSNSGVTSDVSPSSEGIFKPAEQLKTGSVMDILRSKTLGTASFKNKTEFSATSCNIEPTKDEKKKAVDTSSCKLNGGETGSTEKPSLTELFKKPSNTWECPTCMIRNKQECSKCVACETARPGATTTAKPATMEPIPNIPVDKSLAEKFKKPEGSWECDTCMVNNSSTATKCIACETPKPGETKATSFITAGGFQFAPGATSSSNSQFTSPAFGQSSAQEKTDSVSNSGFKFGAPPDSKNDSDSVKSESGSKSEPSKGGGFKFGQSLGSSSATSVAPATGGFSFGQSSGVDSSKTESGFTAGFKFSSTTQTRDNKKDEGAKPIVGFTFGQSISSFGGSKPSDNKTQPSGVITSGMVPASTGSTGATPKAESGTSGMFKMGTGNVSAVSTAKTEGNSATTPSTSSVVGISSGISKGAEAKPVFAFGSMDKKDGTTSNTASSLFTFGKTTNAPQSAVLGVPQKTDNQTAVQSTTTGVAAGTAPSTFGAVNKSQDEKPTGTSPFVFGQTTQPSGGGLTFGSHSEQPAASAAFGSQPATNSAFGSQSAQPAVSTAFGSQPTQPAGNVTFGSQSALTAGSSSVLGQPGVNTGFGSQTATTTAPSFTFGAAAAAAASTNGPTGTPAFSFSAKPNDKPEVATTTSSVFNLASGTTTSSTSSTSTTNLFAVTGAKQESPMSAQPTLTNSSPFQFGQSTAPSGSLFIKPATSTTTTASPFMFGQPTSTTSSIGTFGSQPASAFGVTTSTPAFGTPSQQTKPPTVFGSGTATPSFQFGGQQPTVPQPSTGAVFQFGQNAQQPAAPTSGFNFGAGIASPSAGSTVTPISFGGSTPVNTNFTGTANPAGSTFQFNAVPSGANSNPFSVTTPASARRVKTARRKLPRK